MKIRPIPVDGFLLVRRPGYFGRRRDAIVKDLNDKYGVGEWELRWYVPSQNKSYSYEEACIFCYEESYFQYLKDMPLSIDYICSFKECIDNAITNIFSGCDYTKQEAFSTHIQDIAVRNVLRRLERKFTGREILTIRSEDSNGYIYGPGNIPYMNPDDIYQPSKAPKWAKVGSVEDFWQSNKFIGLKQKDVI